MFIGTSNYTEDANEVHQKPYVQTPGSLNTVEYALNITVKAHYKEKLLI